MVKVNPQRIDPRLTGVYTERCLDIECNHPLAMHIKEQAGTLMGPMVPCRTVECMCQRYRSEWWDRALMMKEGT